MTRQVASVLFDDGSRVQPNAAGVAAIERLVRNGSTLAEAVEFIVHGRVYLRQPPRGGAPEPLMGWCPTHEYSHIVAMGEHSVTLHCGYQVM